MHPANMQGIWILRSLSLFIFSLSSSKRSLSGSVRVFELSETAGKALSQGFQQVLVAFANVVGV